MANISILEQDLTTARDTSTTSNVVYVPGYAIMGPVNEPTLCSTLSEFKKVFGAVPYTFKRAQSLTDRISGEKFTTAGDYEKSYIYAAELLKAGLPVLFERIATSDEKAQLTINLGIKSLSVQAITKSEVAVEAHDEAVALTIGEITKELNEDDAEHPFNEYLCGITLESVEGNISVQANRLQNITEEDIYDIVINNDSISFKTKADIDITSENITEYLNITATRHIPAVQRDVIYSAVFNYANNNITASPTIDGVVTSSLTAQIDWNEMHVNIIKNNEIFASLLFEIDNNHNHNIATSSLIAKAKYSGEYGQNINIKLVKNIVDSNTYYTVYVTQVIGSVESSEIKTISFDESNEKYYFENVKFDLIDLEMPTYDYTYDMAKKGLIAIDQDQLDREIPLALSNSSSDTDEFNIQTFYSKLSNGSESIFDKLLDKDAYQVKFITSGGYPTFGLHSDGSVLDDISRAMLRVAANRGDCIALIDHIDPSNGKIENIFNQVKSALNNTIIADNGEDVKKYGAMFTPWAKYKLNVVSGISAFPGSFAYLRCLALSSKTNADWYAVAGATRGQVPDLLQLNNKVGGALANLIQPRQGIAINPITDIKPYGYCIWGNRTLFNNIDDLTASSFLNIRMLTSDVKKVVYKAAKKLTFELNSEILWLNFKAAIEPTLDQMISGNGLSAYKIIKVATNKKATIACKIRLTAVEAVEDWDIAVELADGYTSIE